MEVLWVPTQITVGFEAVAANALIMCYMEQVLNIKENMSSTS